MGAAVGYAIGGKTFSKKAMVYGAIGSLIPDADEIVRFSTDPLAEMIHHRGFTHSVFFAPLLAPILAAWFRYSRNVPFWPMFQLMFWVILIHPLLDVFTTYGTQLLMPFTNHRFSVSAIPVLELTYTGMFFVSVLVISVLKRSRFTEWFNYSVIFVTCVYLLMGVAENDCATHRAEAEAEEKGWKGRVYTFTGLFSIYQRRAVVYDGDHVHVGHFSSLCDKPTVWQTFEQRKKPDMNLRHVKTYIWHTNHHVLYGENQFGLTMSDLRYGLYPNYMDSIFTIQMDSDGRWLGYATSPKPWPKWKTIWQQTFDHTTTNPIDPKDVFSENEFQKKFNELAVIKGNKDEKPHQLIQFVMVHWDNLQNNHQKLEQFYKYVFEPKLSNDYKHERADAERTKEVCRINYDPFSMAQDVSYAWKVRSITFLNPEEMRVDIDFQFSETHSVQMLWRFTKLGWRIYDVRSEKLKESLAHTLGKK